MAENIFVCTVNGAGPAMDGTQYPPPVVLIDLSDQAGSFGNQWFYAPASAKDEMLAVALAAISLGRSVSATVELPNAGGVPFTQIYRLYLLA